MAEGIVVLERTALGILFLFLLMLIPSSASEFIRLRLALMVHSSVITYKAHLVARGFQRKLGRNYDKTFGHVAHMTIVCTPLVVTSVRTWSVPQLDVKNTFINGELMRRSTCD